MSLFARVRLLDAPHFLDKEYTYSIPPHLLDEIEEGGFVTVPFGGGNRRRMGLVTGITPDSDCDAVKPILSATAPRISLSREMLGLVVFLRETTLCATGDAVHAMIPTGALAGLVESYHATELMLIDPAKLSTDEAFLLAHVRRTGPVRLDSLQARFGEATSELLKKLMRGGYLVRELKQGHAMAEKAQLTFALAMPAEEIKAVLSGEKRAGRLGERQREALGLLLGGEMTGRGWDAA